MSAANLAAFKILEKWYSHVMCMPYHLMLDMLNSEVIAYIVKCGMKLLIYSQTSTIPPLNLGMVK